MQDGQYEPNRSGDFIDFLRNVLSSLHSPCAGVMLTAAVEQRSNGDAVTVRIEFHDATVSARESRIYHNCALVEEWVDSVDEALLRVLDFIKGDGKIDGHAIPFSAKSFHGDRRIRDYERFTEWPEYVYRASNDVDNRNSFSNSNPTLKKGLPPFSSGSSAANHWVWSRSKSTWGSSREHEHELLVVIPDTRGKLSRMVWMGDELRLEATFNVNPEELTYQILFETEGGREHISIDKPSEDEKVEIPDTTRTIEVFLIGNEDRLLDNDSMKQPGELVSKGSGLTPTERAKKDFHGGESHEVEFKPFIKQMDKKEREILRTVVAFANTYGGRLYLGVSDNGVPKGWSELFSVAGNSDASDAMDAVVERTRKIIGDGVHPVPDFRLQVLEIYSEPVLLIEVQKGDDRPYSLSKSKEIYVRKSASDERPEPRTELKALYKDKSEAEFM